MQGRGAQGAAIPVCTRVAAARIVTVWSVSHAPGRAAERIAAWVAAKRGVELKAVRAIAAVAGIVFVGVQLLPQEFTTDNPPVEASIAAPAAVEEILRSSCFDCHSNETRWPFYAYVAPASWLVTADVAGGRSRMNFSDWETLRPGFQKRFARRIVERIENGEMPMWQYTALHWGSRPDAAELEVLRAWRDELNAPAEAADNQDRP